MLLVYTGLKEKKGQVQIVGTYYRQDGGECMKAAKEHLARKGAHYVIPTNITIKEVAKDADSSNSTDNSVVV